MPLTLALLALLIAAVVVEGTRRAHASKALLDALNLPTSTGDAFYRAVVFHLTRTLGADGAAITELSSSGTRLRTLAAVADGRSTEPLEYDVAGTPNVRAIAAPGRVVFEELPDSFPMGRLSQIPGLRGYAGVALLDSNGTPLGVLALFSRRPFRNTSALNTVLKIAAQRASAEIDRQRSMQALHTSDARANAILSALPDLMFVQDCDGRYLDYHAGTRSDLFVAPEEFLGKSFTDLLPPDVVDVVRPVFRSVVTTGESASVEYQLSMPGGAEFYEARLVNLAPDRVLSIVRNVTDRKRAESALERSEYFTQTLAETIPNVIFLYDLEEQRNLYVNGRSEAVLGYTAEEVVNMRDEFLPRTMHPDDLPRLPQLAADYLQAKDGEALEHVFRFRHKNGEWRWIHRCAMVFARTEEGKPRQVLGSATDITALKVAEQELRSLSTRLRTGQDEERRRIARELHDGVAQVLFGIGACLKSLRQRADLPPDATTALAESGTLCDEGLKEVRLLSYVLHPPLLEEIGLVPALKWFAEGFQRRSGITVEVQAGNADDRLPLAIERDLFRIVQEGLSNVVRHSGSTKAVVRVNREVHGAVLQIEDFGHGMQTTFERNDRELPRPGVGILGMRERLRHVGGRLEIQSTAQGTTLTAIVPIES